jgi:hypothetical protein
MWRQLVAVVVGFIVFGCGAAVFDAVKIALVPWAYAAAAAGLVVLAIAVGGAIWRGDLGPKRVLAIFAVIGAAALTLA